MCLSSWAGRSTVGGLCKALMAINHHRYACSVPGRVVHTPPMGGQRTRRHGYSCGRADAHGFIADAGHDMLVTGNLFGWRRGET